MPTAARLTLWLSTLIMETSWISAWLTFLSAAVSGRLFPVPEAALCSLLASLAYGLTSRLRWRGVYVAAVHGLVLSLFWMRDVQLALGPSRPHPVFALVLLVLASAGLWAAGVLHARRARDFRAVCGRFDFGLYWLFALLCGRVLLRGQAGIPASDPIVDALVPSYFVTGICAITVARSQGQASKGWTRASGKLSVLAAGLGAVLVLGLAGTWMVRPYLRALAESSHAGAVVVADQTADAAIRALRKLRLKAPRAAPMRERSSPPAGGERARKIEQALLGPSPDLDLRMVWQLLGGLAALGCGLVLVFKRRWLFSRQAGGSLGWWAWWRRLFGRRWRRPRPVRAPEPVRLYGALKVWGARSGLPEARSETPLEYARRLRASFAAVSSEIDLIVDLYNLHTYALVACDGEALQEARRALGRLRSPRRWWLRWATWWKATES